MFDPASRRDAIRRACVVFLAVLGLVAASSFSAVHVEAQTASYTTCSDALTDDLASECEFETAKASSTSTSDCYFEADCPTGAGTATNWTTITVPLSDVGNLQNCSGTLALSC